MSSNMIQDRQELNSEQADSDDLLPNECLCPIMQEVMEHPVMASDGHTYEESAIQTWFRQGGKISPKTGIPLPNFELTPNHTIRSLIQDLKKQLPTLVHQKLEMDRIREAIQLREEELIEKNKEIDQLRQQRLTIEESNKVTNSWQAVAQSGVTFGEGLTRVQQGYFYNKTLYIDTPGLYDVNVAMREQAAKEIEKALKHNNNYKIVFVATLESGRIKPVDLVMVNTICDAIRTDFEYGIIFNQVATKVKQKIEQDSKNPVVIAKYLKALNKQPTALVMLEKINAMEGENKMYFDNNHENRCKILKFLDQLKTYNIVAQAVNPLDISDDQVKIAKMESSLKNTVADLQKALWKFLRFALTTPATD
eukprot:gene1033-1311_t